MANNKTIKTITLTLGVLGGLFVGCLITLFAIFFLNYKFHWFEGMSLMVAILLLVPAGGIVAAILTGIIYNKRLKIILAGEMTRKKELAALAIVPALFILISIYPKISNLYSSPKPSQAIAFIDAMNRVFYSTSELNKPPDNEFGEYGPQNLFDGDNKTCWAEGAEGPGLGEYVYLDIPSKTRGVYIVNGYAKSGKSFNENNRVQRIDLTLVRLSPPKESEVTESQTPMKIKKESFTLTRRLEDKSTPQKINFPAEWQKVINEEGKTALKLEIVSVYQGSKYDDTCLSEVTFTGDRLSLGHRDSDLWIEDAAGKRLLFKTPGLVLQIIDAAGDWVILIKMPLESEGRSETTYSLFNIPLQKEINLSRLGYNAGQMYGLEERGKTIYLTALDNKTLKEIKINLNELDLASGAGE